MNILKFGGTSVANADILGKVKDIVSAEITTSGSFPVVVVSACAGITNKLILAGNLAEAGDEQFRTITREIEKHHLALASALLPYNDYVNAALFISGQLRELDKITYGIYLLKELTSRTYEKLVSFGERLSAYIISSYFSVNGIPAIYTDASECIITDDRFTNARVDFERSAATVKAAINNKNAVPVVTGFTGRTVHGDITTLGRGGSDYTAAALGSILNAGKVEIWTDVNGFYTADPAKVPEAETISVLSYEEAFAITWAGAKVIYPPTILPAYKKGIPIYVKCTAEPEKSGTLISSSGEETKTGVTGISVYDDAVLLTVSFPGSFADNSAGTEVISLLEQSGVPVYLSFRGSAGSSVTVCVTEENSLKAQSIIEDAREHHKVSFKEISYSEKKDLSVLTVIASTGISSAETAARILSVLNTNSIPVYGLESSYTSLTVSVVTDKEHELRTLRTLHQGFFTKETKRRSA